MTMSKTLVSHVHFGVTCTVMSWTLHESVYIERLADQKGNSTTVVVFMRCSDFKKNFETQGLPS